MHQNIRTHYVLCYDFAANYEMNGFPSFDFIYLLARVNLNKNEDLVTNNTHRRPRIYQLKSLLLDPNLLSKSTSKCEHCETIFTS